MHNWGTSVKNEKNLEAWTHPALTWTLLSESFMPRWRIFTMGSKSSVALQVLFIGLVLLTQEMPGSRDGTIAGKRRIWYPGSSAQCFFFSIGVLFCTAAPSFFTPYPYYRIDDHFKCLKYLEIVPDKKEVGLLSNVLQLGLPGLGGTICNTFRQDEWVFFLHYFWY